MTLTQAVEQFTTFLRANRRSEGTIDCYRRDLLGLVRYAGDLDVEALTPDRVHRFVAADVVQLQANGSPRSPVTVNRCKAALRSFGAWLADTGLVPRSPAAGLEIRRTERRSPQVLTDPERKRMVKELAARKGEAADRDRVMLELLLGTGIRLAELVGLDVADVDLDGKHITAHVKGGRIETRFLNTDLRRLLRHYLRRRAAADSESPALFLSNRRQRISSRQVQARFKQWLGWAGIDRPGLSPHSLRHTFGTRLYARSKDLLLVAKALGHRCVETSRIYVHEDTAALEDALESL
ncbi:MAG: integrase [Deltaproteobacteria bacterium]|nr:integrase [Deltaproteobacteria bacterium]